MWLLFTDQISISLIVLKSIRTQAINCLDATNQPIKRELFSMNKIKLFQLFKNQHEVILILVLTFEVNLTFFTIKSITFQVPSFPL